MIKTFKTALLNKEKPSYLAIVPKEWTELCITKNFGNRCSIGFLPSCMYVFFHESTQLVGRLFQRNYLDSAKNWPYHMI